MKWAALIFLGLVAYIFADGSTGSSGYETVTAKVYSVDWRCKLKSGRSRQSSEIDYGDCSDDADFIANRSNPTKARRTVFSGEAVVGATYIDAGRQGSGQAVFSIDASRPEFYTIEPGATVRVGISKTDPEGIRFVELVKSPS